MAKQMHCKACGAEKTHYAEPGHGTSVSVRWVCEDLDQHDGDRSP